MPLPRASRARLVWALELSLGLELYACAVLALHARGLRATPLDATPALVLPALVIPPVFYVLVALVSVRPLTIGPVLVAVAAMSGLHALLVAATGALFMIPDLLDYGAAVAFALWGSPAVTLLQLTAAPLVFARLRPLVSSPRAPRADTRPAPTPRQVETPVMAPPLVAAKPFVTPLAPTRPHAAPAATLVRPSASPFRSRPGHAAVPTVPSGPALAPSAPSAVGRPAVPPAPVAVAEPVVKSGAPPSTPPAKRALDWTEPTIRVPFVRIADQLPVEMFARGRDGLKDTLRPGVSLLVPRKLLLPYLGEGLAPVKWEVVADQFPLDELALSHEEIAERLPDGSLLLPLDEVIPQIPSELLALSTPPADVQALEDFPAPFQPHAPEPEPETPRGAAPREIEVARSPAAVAEPAVAGAAPVEAAGITESAGVAETVEIEDAAASPAPHIGVAAAPVQSERAARVAALLTPLLNGLEIGQRAAGGTMLVTVVAPALSEEAVVRTAVRVVPFLTDARLPERVTQATLTAVGATVVLTPFGSPDADGALLVTAVASRASLAWLERLSRTAAREAQSESGAGKRARPEGDAAAGIELRAASVPTAVRELAGSLTAFGPVAPTLLRDHAGTLSACLFLPTSLDALPLARFARDMYATLASAEIGRVASVILKLGARRVILKSMDGPEGNVTMLVGVGRIDRPGLARIELDRAATRLETLVRG